MDPEIVELKRMVAESLEIAKDTNKAVHSLRRNARWAAVFRVIYWIVILGLLGVSFTFLTPYLTQLEQMYSSLQTGVNTVQTTTSGAQNYLQNVQNAVKKIPAL